MHATAGEILTAVNADGLGASRATIYNSLRALLRAGLVREVFTGQPSSRFDATLEPHHHYVCDRCGSIEDLPWFDVPASAAIQALDGRAARRYEVVFHGMCRNCRNSESGRGDI